MVGEDFPVILDWPGAQDNNVMHAKPDLRVFLKWMITRSGSVITDVITLTNHDQLAKSFSATLRCDKSER